MTKRISKLVQARAVPDLIAALEEALDLFAHEFCYKDGRVVLDHTTGKPYNAGGVWVQQARAAIAKARGQEGNER